MVKFYFTAVSNSAKKRLAGALEADDERSAREKINKAGMAILSLATEQPADWKNTFEFSVTKKNGEELVGELLEESVDAVFDRLAGEFDFAKINYIFSSTASEEEKLRARENSVREIVARKQKEQAQKKELEKRTITGSLKSLVNLGEKKQADQSEINLAKYSSASEEDLTKKTAADVAAPAKPDAENIKKINLDEESDSPEKKEEVADEPDWRDQLKKISLKLKSFLPAVPEKFSRFYFITTEIAVPPAGKTRKDGWAEMKNFLFPPKPEKNLDEIQKAEGEKALQRKSTIQRFWISFEEIIDLLAAVFLAYLGLGIVSLYVEIPRISELAEKTLRDNYMIHYLAGAFIFVRILILLREKFTSWSPLRTSLLFLFGSIVLVFAGINLL